MENAKNLQKQHKTTCTQHLSYLECSDNPFSKKLKIAIFAFLADFQSAKKNPVSPFFPPKHGFLDFLTSHITEKKSKIRNFFRKSFFKHHLVRKPKILFRPSLSAVSGTRPQKKNRFSIFSSKVKILADSKSEARARKVRFKTLPQVGFFQIFRKTRNFLRKKNM